MARRYHLDPLPAHGRADLDPDVSHHLARVMRARPDESIVLFDGRGAECDATITEITGTGRRVAVHAEVGAHRPSPNEPTTRVHLAFAAPKGSRADWLFEHGTEVGVAVFHPLVTARAVANDARRLARWRRLVTAATGQCDRGRIPEIRTPRPLEELLADPTLPAERYLADLDGESLRGAASDAVLALIGPEGGFTAAERALLREHGCAPRRLGVTTLRTETAALACAVRLLTD